MTEDALRARTRAAVGACGIGLAAPGLALLFAGAEVSPLLFGLALPEIVTAIMAAAFLGFASMNWIARHHVLGGIYGRAVVAANQVHFTIGALVLARRVLVHGGAPGLWLLTALYVGGALYFNALLYGTGISRPKAEATRS